MFTKKAGCRRHDGNLPYIVSGSYALFKRVLYLVVGDHFFFEHISAGLGRLLHLDDLAVSTSFTFLK